MAFAQIQLITQPTDKPTFKTVNGSQESCVIGLLDERGKPVDLTRYWPVDDTPITEGSRRLPITTGPIFTVVSYVGQSIPDVNRAVTVEGDPTEGNVSVELLPSDLLYPGLYLAEISLAADGVMEDRYPFYIESSPSLQWAYNAPVSIAEIRLWSRDNDPETNDLLDEVEFKDSEIIAAIRRTVDLWNSTPPMLHAHTYTTVTFPQMFRSQWIDATIGFLKEMAADWYDRNHLDYSAGGLSIGDRNKGKTYREDALRRLQQFKVWMDNTKRQLNLNGAWGRTGYFRLP